MPGECLKGSEEPSGRDEFLRAHLGLVRGVVKRFAHLSREDELFQAGCIGLWKAGLRYDPLQGTKFSTYAVALILGEIRRFLRDEGPDGIDRTGREKGQRTKKAQDKLRLELGREPTAKEVAEELGITVAELALFLERATAPSSWEEEGESIRNASWLDPSFLPSALRSLDPQAKALLLWRYFRERTQAETGMIMGLTQVQVSRLEKKVLARLRIAMEG